MNGMIDCVNKLGGPKMNKITLSTDNPSSPGATGRKPWSIQEHCEFIRLVLLYGPKNIKQIAEHIPDRTPDQVRSHAQKYFSKINACIRDAKGETGELYDRILQQRKENFKIALQVLAERQLSNSSTSLEYQFFTLFGKNKFGEPNRLDSQLDSQIWEEEKKIFMVVEPLFSQSSRSHQGIYIPLPALAKAFAKLRRLFPGNVLWDNAPYLDEINSQDQYALVANAVAGRQTPRSTICFVQCVYTKSSDLQIQGTTLQGKMNTTLIQDPTSSSDPIFVQCNVRLFTRHCAAYLSANFNDD